MGKVKKKTVYICKNCGYESPKWYGRCPNCGSWNSFEEMVKIDDTETEGRFARFQLSTTPKMERLVNISEKVEERYPFGVKEVDRVLGGGIVKGEVLLIAGEPGIGKSTLTLQLSNFFSKQYSTEVLYINAEESNTQLKLRARRLGIENEQIILYPETDIKKILNVIEEQRPGLVVADSIQALWDPEIDSSPGGVTQVKEVVALLTYIAKTYEIPTILIGHVTKEGILAGPKIVEHIVDAVLMLESDTKGVYRVLRALKNRFGSTEEVGLFKMTEKGFIEILNPIELYNWWKEEFGELNTPGVVVFPSLEGTRVIFLELQALVTDTHTSFPRRIIEGMDINRTLMQIAIMEKHLGLRFGNKDIFLNIVGGFKVYETAIDLALISAIISSTIGKTIPSDMIIFGEVGLSGEVRSVQLPNIRVQDISRLGFQKAIIPFTDMKKVKAPENVELIGIKHIKDLLRVLF